MKVFAYKDYQDKLILTVVKNAYNPEKFIGELELDIKPGKKLVEKGADYATNDSSFDIMLSARLPKGAKNIKLTYQIEE